jgi:hypothetical protein
VRSTLALAALVAAACEPIGVDKPKPPDVSLLVAGYREPSGVLNDANVAGAIDALEAKLGLGEAVCGWDAAVDLLCAGDPDCPLRQCEGLTDVIGAVDDLLGTDDGDAGPTADAGPTIEDIHLRGEGFLRVTRICPGDLAEPVADADANGVMELVAGFTDRGVDPIVWGTVDRCLLRLVTSVRIDGSVVLVLGDGPWLPSDPFAPIVRIEGSATVGDTRGSIGFDFAFDLEGEELSLRFDLPDGSGLVFFVGLSAAGFRTAEGEWQCDFGARTCTDGGQSLSW